MDVILLEKVENLGNIGDHVKVRSGYGRNYLLPKGKATLATPENIAVFEARRSEFEQKQAAELADAEARKTRLAAISVTIPAKAGEEGKLFGSIGTIDIADACTAAGVDVQRSEVRMPDGPIRILGQHEIEIHLHSDVNVVINVSVIGDEVSAEEIAVMSQVSDAATPSESDAGESADDEAGQS